MSLNLNGVGKTFAYMEGYDSTLLAWIPSPPFSAGGGSGGSTQVSVSSVAGRVGVAPSDTNWASSAGFHFDGSGNLNIAGSFSASTTVQVSSAAGRVTTDPFSTSWAGNAGFHFDGSGNLNIAGSFSASTTVQVSSLAGKVLVDQNSSVWQVQVHGDSTAFQGGAWSVRAFQSTATDLNVTVANFSTAVRVGQSSQADLRATIYQSTAADLNVTAAQAGTWTVRANLSSTNTDNPVRAILSSTSADNPVNAAQAGTWTVTIGTNLQSTAAPSSNSSGLVVRQVIDGLTTFASTSALASTTVEVASSAANIRHYVTAYSITSTNQTPAQWGFFSSNGTLLWPITLAALSSATCGANLAVAPPGYLFRTTASDALNFKTAGSTVATVQLAVSYYRAV